MKIVKKLNKLIHINCLYGLKGTVLYEGTTHQNDIVLSDNIKNYEKIKVWASSADRHNVCLELLTSNMEPYNNLVGSFISGSYSDAFYIKFGRIVMTETSLTLDRERELSIKGNTHTVTVGNTYTILKVVGYNY